MFIYLTTKNLALHDCCIDKLEQRNVPMLTLVVLVYIAAFLALIPIYAIPFSFPLTPVGIAFIYVFSFFSPTSWVTSKNLHV